MSLYIHLFVIIFFTFIILFRVTVFQKESTAQYQIISAPRWKFENEEANDAVNYYLFQKKIERNIVQIMSEMKIPHMQGLLLLTHLVLFKELYNSME